VEIPKLFRDEGIHPDWIVLLGDSNTVGVSFPLKKEGYKIAHVEAGMRSGDRRMLEEINRTVCDHCSDALFVYHDDYRDNLARENITKNVFVVGNTIVEEAARYSFTEHKRKDGILVDIHRPENFNDKDRLHKIIEFANECISRYKVPVKILYFKRLVTSLEKFGITLGKIEMTSLMPHKEYLESVYHSLFIISDSGTGQEEPALLGTRVIVPRDFTERPQSYKSNCSFRLSLNPQNFEDVYSWLEEENPIDTKWLGEGNTSRQVTQILAGLQ
jgi:UDP-N-acetylglucosamine 2-epimerase (non-hydrolysing)